MTMAGDQDQVDLDLVAHHGVEDMKIKEEEQEVMKIEGVETLVGVLGLKSDVILDMVTEIVEARANQQTQI